MRTPLDDMLKSTKMEAPLCAIVHLGANNERLILSSGSGAVPSSGSRRTSRSTDDDALSTRSSFVPYDVRKAVMTCLHEVYTRAEYEALKVIACSLATGLHISAMALGSFGEQHAILVGHEEVIYFTEEGVISCTWVHFLQLFPTWRTVARPDGDICEASNVVARARAILADPMSFGEYSMVWNNSEHFATYCFSGQKSSEEVQQNAVGATAGVLVAGAAGANICVSMVSAAEMSYIFGFIPIGTVATFSALTIAGATLGVVTAGLLVGPLAVQTYRHFALQRDFRLPVALVNDTSKILYAKTLSSIVSHLVDTICKVDPSTLVEIYPNSSSDEFELAIYESRWDWTPLDTIVVKRGQVVRYCGQLHVVSRFCLPAYDFSPT
eukprot:GEMP01026658.1.p1 GENE.GEMP01026658.1~~GEMP01026658.1.p1  ORF type:complete len:382 (+),score=67.32 GEMP01026658.1:179-1324(+)